MEETMSTKIQNKEVRDLVDWANSKGWTSRVGSKNHIICRGFGKTVVISATPSCSHAIRNAKKDLIRAMT